MAKRGATSTGSASDLIDARIQDLGDWRGELLAQLRSLIKDAVPEVLEEWKWRGVPVWSHHGIICTGEAYKSVVKATFAKGASLADPTGLFNSSLEGNTRRAIDWQQGEKLDKKALKALIQAAAALNTPSGRAASKKPADAAKAPSRKAAAKKPPAKPSRTKPAPKKKATKNAAKR